MTGSIETVRILPDRIREGIIFRTDKNKDLHRQLQKNPKVELCFVNAGESSQVRIGGEAERLEDQGLKEEIVGPLRLGGPWKRHLQPRSLSNSFSF